LQRDMPLSESASKRFVRHHISSYLLKNSVKREEADLGQPRLLSDTNVKCGVVTRFVGAKFVGAPRAFCVEWERWRKPSCNFLALATLSAPIDHLWQQCPLSNSGYLVIVSKIPNNPPLSVGLAAEHI
jgi:hypothetical protein